ITIFPANAQTTQDATQNTSIQGDDNEVNQVINQYYYKNPGKGAMRRKQPVDQGNPHQSDSTNINRRENNNGNREWGHSQGASHSNGKK
ncbi:MAG: hypothetical protein RI580_14215, partial [Halothece sp. Uz-M2-17]|nr:hypothetical protein [Halothece sp. Uz-M2-17]